MDLMTDHLSMKINVTASETYSPFFIFVTSFRIPACKLFPVFNFLNLPFNNQLSNDATRIIAGGFIK